MNACTTLSVLNTATEWESEHSCMPGLKFVNDAWYDEVSRRLHMYTNIEEDILHEWSLLYSDKPPPLAACDDDHMRDPGVLLLQAESSYTIRVYFFDEESDNIIHTCGFYRQPISTLIHSFRKRIKWVLAFTRWYRQCLEVTYAPNGHGYKRAYEEFQKIKEQGAV